MRRALEYAPLARLEARRVARSGIGFGVLCCLGLAALVYGLDSAGGDPSAQHALLRRGLWELTLLFLLPALALHGAGVIPRWRRGEADWLAPRASRSGALAATATGLALGVALVSALPAAGAALTPWERNAAVADRCVLVHELGAAALVSPQETLQFALDGVQYPQSGRLRMRVMPAAGGGRVRDVRLALVRDGSTNEASLVLQGPAWIEVELPRGSGRVAVGLHNAGEGAVLVPGANSVQVFGREGSNSARFTDLWLRCVRALAVLVVLAMGCGAWMGTGPAAGCALVLPLVLESALGSGAWLPWSDLRPALALMGEGRMDQAVGIRPWLSSLLWILGGLLLGRLGLRSWSVSA
ncbi:MAG: hypothetical protein ACI8QC_003191 [Planctomycetota bacterium]